MSDGNSVSSVHIRICRRPRVRLSAAYRADLGGIVLGNLSISVAPPDDMARGTGPHSPVTSDRASSVT